MFILWTPSCLGLVLKAVILNNLRHPFLEEFGVFCSSSVLDSALCTTFSVYLDGGLEDEVSSLSSL